MTIVIFNIAISSIAQVAGTFKDSRDGKIYKTVKIGTQTWMAQNLAYKPSSGCWSYDNNQSNVITYGYLYNWETAKKACPSSWHLPTNAEWEILTGYLGTDSIAGGKLKEAGTKHWASPNTGATNQSGFSGLPGGNRDTNGGFNKIGKDGGWWSSTELNTSFARNRNLISNPDYPSNLNAYIYSNVRDKESGFSVRCISDK